MDFLKGLVYEAGLNEQDLDGQNQGNQRKEGRASEHL